MCICVLLILLSYEKAFMFIILIENGKQEKSKRKMKIINIPYHRNDIFNILLCFFPVIVIGTNLFAGGMITAYVQFLHSFFHFAIYLTIVKIALFQRHCQWGHATC